MFVHVFSADLQNLMKRHSLSNTALKPLPTISPTKPHRRSTLQTKPSTLLLPFPQTPAPKKLPPMQIKLFNQYLVREQTIPSSDDGSKYMEEIQVEKKHKPIHHHHHTKTKLIGNDAVKTFYNFYKNMDKERKKPEAMNREALLQILDILEKHDFPPETMNLIKEKGREEILYLKGFGLLSDKRKTVLEQITAKINFFTKAVLSHNSLNNLSFLLNLTNLQQLDLSNNSLSLCSLPTLRSFLTKSPHLTTLNLQNNFLFDTGGSQLIEQLTVYQRITILNLSRNGLSGKTAKALKELLASKAHLVELYLHWNQFDEEAGREVFMGLEANRRLKVMDFSWNYLGGKKGCTKAMGEAIQRLTSLVHLDLSFCGFGEEESRMLSEYFEKNHSIFGLHFQGNYGYVNHKGFLICQDNLQDPLTKMKYPLPINTNYGLKRINGIQPNNQRYHFRSQRSTKDVCWICQSWVEIQFDFQFDNSDPKAEYFVYFNFEGFKGVKLPKDGNIMRMCPRGQVYFFFSKVTIKGSEYFVSDKFEVKEKDMKGVKVGFEGEEVQLKSVNTLNAAGKHPIDEDYQPDIYTMPRVPDNDKYTLQNKHNKKKNKKKGKHHNQPKPYKTLAPFDFSQSPFQDWKVLSDEIIDKCIQFDFRQSKLQTLFQQTQSSWNLKLSLRPYYTLLSAIYYQLASHCRIRNNYFSYPIQLRDLLLSSDICDKRLPSSVLTVIFGSVIPKLHEFQLDVDHSAKNITTTFQTINRPQFFELIYRVAYEKYTKKPKQYILEKMAKKKEMMESRIRFQFQREDGGEGVMTESQVMTVKKNRVYLTMKEALVRVVKQLEQHYRKIDSHVFRTGCVWTAPVNLVLESYQALIKPLYMKYTHFTTKFKIKQPGMYFEDWISIFTSAALAQQDNKHLSRIFLVCKMVQVEEGSSPPQLQYCQFLESLVRVAELVSVRNPFRKDIDHVHPTQYPVCFKLEYLLLHLYKRNTDLSNKFVKRLLEKGGLFTDEFTEYLSMLKKGADLPAQLFSTTNRITLEAIIDSQRMKHQQKMQQLALHEKLEMQRLQKEKQKLQCSSSESESS